MSFQRKPIEIKRLEEAGLRISWSDGSVVELPSEKLRRECPCATCRAARGDTSHDKPLAMPSAKKSSLKILSASATEETQLRQVWAIGNYAIGIEWGDGHSSGIYTYEQLSQL